METTAALIDRYERGGAAIRAAVRGLSRDDLLAVPVPGKWSIQQVIIHLSDGDPILSDRMKRIIAEDNPMLTAFDENKFAANLFYDEQPAEEAAALVDLNRRLFCRVLRKLPAAAFGRVGTHDQRGVQKLIDVLTMATNHLEHHLKFVAEKRERLGK